MRKASVPAIALAAVALFGAGPAFAQDYDAGYQDDGGYGDYGYPPQIPDERDYGTRPPPNGATRPMPGYRDNGNWRSGETWSSTDARRETAPDYPPPPPPTGSTKGDRQAYRDAQADYRARLDAWNRQYGAAPAAASNPRDQARIGRWRARADACEAGDRAACDGPE